MALLDTRDAELRLWQDGAALRSPGFVLFDDGRYQFGESAVAQAKRRPRDVNNRFWWQLTTQPLQPPLGPARHTADLVHAHLAQLHRDAGSPGELVLAVPDSMPRSQLSLLLGIAQASDFAATGLVSRSVLLGSAAGVKSRALHVELQLHQAVINELRAEDGNLILARSTPLPACGLLALQERCISAIATAFIQQTRFDPRRSADTEQQLYDRLPEILAALAERGEYSVDIEGNHCQVVASNVAGATERLGEGLGKALDGADIPVLIDHSLELLAATQKLPGDLQAIADDALWRAYEQHAGRILGDSDGLHLVDRLPLGEAPAPTAPPARAPATAATGAVSGPGSDAATHVLLDTRALPLRGDRVPLAGSFALARREGHWTIEGAGALINGMPASPGQPLRLGDTLSLGSSGHGRLIEVVD
jgi:hypothetical protein